MKEIRRLRPALGSPLDNQRGTVIVLVGVGMLVFLGVAALAVDLGYLYVVRNELQNAADAGALAGARVLYNDNGTLVNEGANQVAYDAATANRSDNAPVEVNWTSGNTGDIERGHWRFATRTFTPKASTTPVDLWNVSWDELDANENFINAIRSGRTFFCEDLRPARCTTIRYRCSVHRVCRHLDTL
jgi:Flp pilus assembly protein TadG